jgi:hypothetical protein
VVGAADLGAASLAAAVGPVAEALRGAGDERVMEFTKEDQEAISAAIHEAEKRTCGQIVCVLAHSSSEYAYVPILWATVLALLVPWPLIDFTQWSVQRIFLLQLMVFILAGKNGMGIIATEKTGKRAYIPMNKYPRLLAALAAGPVGELTYYRCKWPTDEERKAR